MLLFIYTNVAIVSYLSCSVKYLLRVIANVPCARFGVATIRKITPWRPAILLPAILLPAISLLPSHQLQPVTTQNIRFVYLLRIPRLLSNTFYQLYEIIDPPLKGKGCNISCQFLLVYRYFAESMLFAGFTHGLYYFSV